MRFDSNGGLAHEPMAGHRQVLAFAKSAVLDIFGTRSEHSGGMPFSAWCSTVLSRVAFGCGPDWASAMLLKNEHYCNMEYVVKIHFGSLPFQKTEYLVFWGNQAKGEGIQYDHPKLKTCEAQVPWGWHLAVFVSKWRCWSQWLLH